MRLPTLLAALLLSTQTFAAEEPAPPPQLCVDEVCTSTATSGYEFPPGPTTASAAPLKAVATFNSIGLYWDESSGAESNEALVRFRKAGAGVWRQGLSLWFDKRTSDKIPYGSLEYRGSLVELDSNSTYEVEVLTAGSRRLTSTRVTTWNETFPIGSTVTLPTTSNSTLNISQSGTASGYRLYTSAPGGSATIDGNNKLSELVVISGSYVILRGVTLKNSSSTGILLTRTAHHVVIEGNDIFNIGHADPVMPQFGCKSDAHIITENQTWPTNQYVKQIVIQNNKLHHPNYDSNSWEETRMESTSCGPPAGTSHPAGTRAIYFKDTGGNHVIRYNEVYSDLTHMFDDGIGGGQNFSVRGPYGSDSDIHGNKVSHVWDDAIESEGANQNVRISGNYTEQTMVSIAAAPVSIGPLYVFRNVATKGIRAPDKLDGYGWFFKTRSKSADGTVAGINMGGGRTYLYHNTLYRTGISDSINQMLNIDSISAVNIVSRNNIINGKSQISSSLTPMPYSTFDYDMFTVGHTNWSAEEPRGIEANPVYDSASTSGKFTLQSDTAGVDACVVIPNFNDQFSGGAPDAGAQERGRSALRFGKQH